jgi:hypothetical protein
MSRPQQPELARSAKTDLDPDHVETGLQGQRHPGSAGETGPVPPENQPGHHPPKEQDKPDLDAFAARLGTDPNAPTATRARKGAPKAVAAKSAPAKTAPAKSGPAKSAATTTTTAKSPPAKSTPAKSGPAKTAAAATSSKTASRPAATAPKQSPAPPPKVEATPAKRPAAAPTSGPASASAPDQDREQPAGREPVLVSLALLPLRETVKRLEQLDRTLTQRLNQKRRSMRGPGR